METITEDYVSFEVAKLLKEKGFDEKCRYVWKLDKANNPQDTDGISKICAERFMEGESFVVNSDIELVSKYEDWLEDYHKAYLCPTLQIAIKWLRKVHNIHIELNWDKGNQLYSYQIWKQGKYQPEISSLDLWRIHKDDNYLGEWIYEEACEAAIKYCLENLI